VIQTTEMIRSRYLADLWQHRFGVDFDPLPHQTPPDGDWFFWLLEAGRGAGKTAAAAHAVRDHLNGPPCITGNLPHRVGLIAPTLGDGIESASLNDQALTRIEPGARLTSSGGGTRVIWPNRSQVRVFGAYTKEDIERLRAGGNRSIAVGTLIETSLGPRPIETIRAGDLVYTNAGLRPVLGSWDHGARPLWKVTTEAGRVLWLTPDHKLWTENGWERTDNLVAGSNITTWNGTVTAGRHSETDTSLEASKSMANQPRY